MSEYGVVVGGNEPTTWLSKRTVGSDQIWWATDSSEAWRTDDRNQALDVVKELFKKYSYSAVLWTFEPETVGKIALVSTGPVVCTECRLKNDFGAANRPDGTYRCWECR